ncbi:MAG: cell envelope integrity protein CreD [Pseudomonadales bacterium]|nr:cell envelope integrity protein CreD [Pseudomonadales bacterium]
MNKVFLIKLMVIVAIALLILIPLQSVEHKVWERSNYRHQAEASISESWTANQALIGPIYIQPYEYPYREKVWDENLKKYVYQQRMLTNKLYLVPDDLQVIQAVKSDIRYRGIYEIPVFTNQIQVSGTFSNQRLLDLLKAQPDVEFKVPYLAVAVSDERGIVDVETLQFGQQNPDWNSGSLMSTVTGGLHARLAKPETTDVETYHFNFALAIRGMGEMAIAPVGRLNDISMQSDWPHPSFGGRFLPESRTLERDGFQARWRLSEFASGIAAKVSECERGACEALLSADLNVSLVNPVDVYTLSLRSLRYAYLFVILTFTAFLMFEILKGVSIHPIQYTMVGLALSMFYLLLVALSEHISFTYSYLMAAVACVLLLGYYWSHVLKGFTRASGFCVVLTIMYGVLFVILNSEDHALLMGALLMFTLLAAVMVLTRSVDWYAVSLSAAEKLKQSHGLSRAHKEQVSAPDAGISHD